MSRPRESPGPTAFVERRAGERPLWRLYLSRSGLVACRLSFLSPWLHPDRRGCNFIGESVTPDAQFGRQFLEAAADAGGGGKAARFIITLPHGSFLMNADPPGISCSPKRAAPAFTREQMRPGGGKPAAVSYSHLMWSSPDILGLFSNNVVSFSRNVVLSGPIFSINVVWKPRMLSVRAVYVLSSLQLA